MSRDAKRKHPMFALEPTTPDAPRIGVEGFDRSHAMALSGRTAISSSRSPTSSGAVDGSESDLKSGMSLPAICS